MALTLVLGPANSAKAGEVLGAYAAAARRGALLVVPTAADARHYSRELAGQGCVLASVLTFTGLAEEIARRAGYAARRLTRVQRDRALERAAGAARLGVLAEAAATGGFAAAVGELVAQLERALVDPRRFAQAMRAWGEEDPRRSGLARDIGSLYLAYSDELQRLGRVDGELFLWRGLDALRAAPAAWGATPAFFYGFDDLTALERDAVETLARVVGAEVTVSLTYEAGKAAVRARAGLVEELRPLAEHVIELHAVDDYYEPESRAALHHLERGLFEPAPADRIDPGRAIRLLESAGARAEAELVAAEVVALLREGVAAEEIAVVYRSLGAVAPLVVHVLGSYGVAASVERRIPFGHTALGRGVLALARCALLPEDDATAGDVLEYVRAPGVLGRPEQADALEAEVIRGRLRTASQALDRFGFELREIAALRRSDDPRGELVRHARRLLAGANRGAAAVLDAGEALDAHALAAMARALDELSDVSDQPSGGELIELLEEVEVDASVRGARDAVTVAEPLAIRARRFRAVFVCGLQEGEFPRIPAPDPFLPDERKRELAACSGLVLPIVEDALDRERYLFYASVSRATERVVLSYRSSDEEGSLELGSPFIADVADLLEPTGATGAAGGCWRIWCGRPTRRRRTGSSRARGLPRSGGGRRRGRRAGGAAARGGRAGAGPAHPARVGRRPRVVLGVRVQVARRKRAAAGRARARGRPAGARQLHPRGARAAARAAGIGGHARVAPARARDPRRADRGAARDGRSRPARAAARRRRRAIAADLRRYLVHEARGGGDWAPRHLELRFGFADERRTRCRRSSSTGPERVAVAGVIDRVDVEPDGRRAIVRDYKSGSPRPEWAGDRWSGDGSLQVALYMLAVRDLLGLEPVAGLYQPLSGRDLRARGVYFQGAPVGPGPVGNDARDEAELGAELEDASAAPVELAGAAAVGRAERRVPELLADGCLYPGICRSTMTVSPEDARSPPEQLEAIERRDGELFLDAGAGSGKTSVLVERFVRAGARGRDRRGGDPHDHLHRKGGRRDARADP